MEATTAIPEGYLEDAQGRLVPLDMVQPVDLDRDKLVNQLMSEATRIQGTMGKFRDKANAKIYAFAEKAAKKYGSSLGGKKGNISLTSYDGSSKVSIAIGTEIWFTEALQVAKKLIDECLVEWSEGAHQNLRVIVDQAFQTDSDGNAIPARILSLKKLKINHVKWKRAMRALTDSQQVGNKKPYLRFYEKDESGEWRQVPLDMARLPTVAE